MVEKFPALKTIWKPPKPRRAQGYVATLFENPCGGNQCQDPAAPLPSAPQINAPIQGTAADIIRRAMVAMPPALEAAGLTDAKTGDAHMLLQVHDELIFEVAEDQAAALTDTVRAVMENACAPRLTLSVPLVVDAEAARNWDEAH